MTSPSPLSRETLHEISLSVSLVSLQSPHMLGLSAGSKALSRADSAQIFKTAYPTRRSSVNIQRQHHWGFKSLRPMPPLKTQQLIALREVVPVIIT